MEWKIHCGKERKCATSRGRSGVFNHSVNPSTHTQYNTCTPTHGRKERRCKQHSKQTLERKLQTGTSAWCHMGNAHTVSLSHSLSCSLCVTHTRKQRLPVLGRSKSKYFCFRISHHERMRAVRATPPSCIPREGGPSFNIREIWRQRSNDISAYHLFRAELEASDGQGHGAEVN